MKKVLIIDDDKDMCRLLARYLERNGFETSTAHSGDAGIARFKEKAFDVVLCDFRLGDQQGIEVLREIRKIGSHATVIIITAYADISNAIDVIRDGAYDYITKPIIPDELLAIIHKALVARSEIKKDIAAKPPRGIFESDDFVRGNESSAVSIYRQVDLVAPTNYSVILYGESGTGKEVLARTLHQNSERRHRPFIAMDCGALSNELAGSELFGHVKGSFTGAIDDRAGHFELARGGTLFLDEVANLSPSIQASLLRVLQERRFRRVGGVKEMDADVRIIVASHENLHESYKNGKFREDLFHRLNEFTIILPPLRDRKKDIPLFAEYFLRDASAGPFNRAKAEGFDAGVTAIFLEYAWPGNLRELRNVVRRAALLTDGGMIAVSALPAEMTGQLPWESPSRQISSEQDLPVQSARDMKGSALKAEYDTILRVLKQVNFNKSKAAEMLHLDRKTLYNKIREHERSKGEGEA